MVGAVTTQHKPGEIILPSNDVLSERQQYALTHPCRHAEEWGPGDFRKEVIRGQVTLYTFLSFDVFARSTPLWNVGVSILKSNHDLKPLASWDHNDWVAAIAEIKSLLDGVGVLGEKGGNGVWKVDAIDFYREASAREVEIARMLIKAMPPLRTGFNFGPAHEVVHGKPILAGRRTDGSGAASEIRQDNIRKRTVRAVRIGD